MSLNLRVMGLLVTAALALPVAGRADTQTSHRAHKAKKEQALPPPLPSGTRGPVPQVPLDAIPAIAPQVSYTNGMLTIVAPNSTLGDILRGVRKHTSADIEIPPTASERVVTRLGPAPAREVMAELLNGSHFNYILMGSPENANDLVRVVLVPRSGPENPAAVPVDPNAPVQPGAAITPPGEGPEPDATPEDNAEENTDQNAAEAEQQQQQQPENQAKTPQQMLQEMQQRQLLLQQQGQPGGVFPPPRQPQPQEQ